jgi:hypothetical protein
MEPTSKINKKSIKPKKAKPFFGPKKKLDTKLSKLPKKGKQATTPLKKPAPKAKKESEKLAIAALKNPTKEIKTASKKYQKHKDSDKVLKEAQGAAILPSKKANETVANRSHVEIMDAQAKDKETKGFNKSGFEKKLKEEIKNTIQKKEDADRIKSEGVKENVPQSISKTVGEEKTKSSGKVEASAINPPAAPQTPSDEVTTSEPQKITPDAVSAKTFTAQKSDLAPESRPKEETDFTKETKVLDDDYQQNNLSQEKLQKSNEPKFIDADNQKQDSETKAKELTQDTRTNEKKTINGTRLSNTKAMNSGYDAMLQKQSSTNKGRFDQQTKKSQEENKVRDDVHKQLTSIFNLANAKVLFCFALIDSYIELVFGKSLTRYLDVFSERVSSLIDDNDGWEYLGKALTGEHIQDDVEIFQIAKDEFVEHMQKPIDDLVDFVDLGLSNAKKAIETGNKQKDEFWAKQSKDTKRIAGDIYEDANSKFEELESSVENKESAIIDTVTEKFSAALDELDDRFEKAKIENMSWLDRAIAAVKSVINTIIELKNALQQLAQKAAKYAERIIDDPIEFFGNLADGVGQGFTNFKNNIDKHLVKGVLEWLTGSMGGEIELPKELNFEGITSLVLQILGITVKKIKGLVIDIIGKERFEFIEKGVDATMAAGNKILNIFKILNEKGLSGLWEFILEEFDNLKEMLIENVKTFVIETITMKAMEYLLSLLIPGAGFIRAAQLIVKFVITLFQKAAQIIKIIDGILDTFGDILDKNLSAVVNKVEMVLSGFLSLAISFLAAVLGLDGIVGKVQKFIQQKIRPKIDQVLKNIANKLKKVLEKIGITKLIDKSMKAVDKGKAWVEDKKKKAVEKGKIIGDKILSFLGIKKPFKLGGKESHTLVLEDKKGNPVFYTHSTPQKYDAFIKKVSFEDDYVPTKGVTNKYNGKTPKETAINAGGVVDGELAKYEKTPEADRKKWGDNVVVHMNNIAEVLTHYAKVGNSEEDIPTIVEWGGTNDKGMGQKVDAKQLSSNYIAGQDTGEEHEKGGLTPDWDIISQNKGTNSVYYYVRGHLLNATIGGIVNNTNLAPFSKSTNSSHLKMVEKHAKKMVTGKFRENDTNVTQKGAISYMVKTIYGSHPKRNLAGLTPQEQLVKDTEETQGVIPTRVEFVLKKLKIDNGKVVEDKSVQPIDDGVDNHLPPVVKLKK